jgi:hypothetical protein
MPVTICKTDSAVGSLEWERFILAFDWSKRIIQGAQESRPSHILPTLPNMLPEKVCRARTELHFHSFKMVRAHDYA